MTRLQYRQIEDVMLQKMQCCAHDAGHVYRVLYGALRIAAKKPKANRDVVILSALLHDIGRADADGHPGLGHAELGARMAWDVLRQNGWSEAVSAHVRESIRTHSFGGGRRPQSLEARILFDADKLDLAGAVGCARALLFGGSIDEPLYLLGPGGLPTPGAPSEGPSLMREYNRKLKKLYRRFYTKKGRQLAKKRQAAMDAYFTAMRQEIVPLYRKGIKLLGAALTPDSD